MATGNESDFMQIFKDAVLIVCPIIGSIVAVLGLKTWNRQLRGSAEYEQSRKLLRAIYKYRNAIQGVRNPAIWVNEQPSPDKDQSKSMTGDQIKYFGISGAYQKRWDKVNETRTELAAELLEVEVIWGNKYNVMLERIYKLERELFSYLRCYLIIIDPSADSDSRNAYSNINNERREVLYSLLDDSKDEFTKELNAVVKSLEDIIRPKLHK